MLYSSSSCQEGRGTVRVQSDDHVIDIFRLVAFLSCLGSSSWFPEPFSERVVFDLQLGDLKQILIRER